MTGLLRDLVSSGHAVDIVLAVMVGEFALLCWRWGSRDRAGAALDAFCTLAPGACLLLALRAALTGSGWVWVAAFLTLSLPIHIADLARRRRA